ncbi:MAG: RNA-binding protein [Sorangium cellulosum]|nr:MAG: RNA-binding protein [Sorangium cellulosum]
MSRDETGRGDESFAALFEKGNAPRVRQRQFSRGDAVDGIVVKIGTEAVFLDLDGKREAFVDRATLVDGEGRALNVDVGDCIHARVAEIGGRAGGIRLDPLSIRRQIDQKNSDEAQQVDFVGASGPQLTAGAHVKGEVTRIESYGVFVQIEGTTGRRGRGLLPAVETGLPRGTDLRKKFPLGKQVEVKILTIEDDGKMRLSIRALQLDEERASFESFSGKGKPKQKGSAKSGFGTLADAFARSTQLKVKKH